MALEASSDRYHYQLIRRAIDRIDAQGPGTASLGEIAEELSLSPAHFQRTFSRWVGVSPKRYQQWLALDHARRLLRERFTVLETAAEVGLSGGGRLHDLFVRWEAMSPGEYGRKGEGLQIFWGWFDGPFGKTLAMGTERGLCGLAFAEETGEAAALADLCGRWPRACYEEAPERLAGWADAAFGFSRSPSTRTTASPPAEGGTGAPRLHLIGAPFQIKVWEALMAVPSGHVTTYSEIAHRVGTPRAVRAVGTAVGRNPISWLIPCHRVLRKTGELGGYHWGLPIKRAMLAYETARLEEAQACRGAPAA